MPGWRKAKETEAFWCLLVGARRRALTDVIGSKAKIRYDGRSEEKPGARDAGAMANMRIRKNYRSTILMKE